MSEISSSYQDDIDETNKEYERLKSEVQTQQANLAATAMQALNEFMMSAFPMPNDKLATMNRAQRVLKEYGA